MMVFLELLEALIATLSGIEAEAKEKMLNENRKHPSISSNAF
jgi:hypothetical protein